MLHTVNVASGIGQLLWLFFKPSGKTSNLFGSAQQNSNKTTFEWSGPIFTEVFILNIEQ